MVRSFLALQRVDLGFAPDHLLTFGVELPDKTYPPDAGIAFWRRLHDRLRALPGVRGAALVEELPPTHSKDVEGVAFPGRSAHDPDEPDWMVDFIQGTTPDALDTLGAPIVRGRGLRPSDTYKAPLVAVVNQTFVAKFFRGRDPIGQKIKVLFGPEREFTVVGVFADVKREAVELPAGTEMIQPTVALRAE